MKVYVVVASTVLHTNELLHSHRAGVTWIHKIQAWTHLTGISTTISIRESRNTSSRFTFSSSRRVPVTVPHVTLQLWIS